ncbi:MAG: hypothetical protein RLZZ139_1240 [Cyanobacteriota bacterium]
MPRYNEDRTRIQCRMRTEKKAELDKRLIDAGFCYKSKDSIYPMYAEFLEALIDGDSRAFKIIFEKALDKLE